MVFLMEKKRNHGNAFWCLSWRKYTGEIFELERRNFQCNLGIKMEDFHFHGMKLWGSAEICSQHPVTLEKNILLTAGYHPSCVYMPSGENWLKNRVFGKVFPLLNVNAIDLLILIKLSVCFSSHNLDKKMTIRPRLRKKQLTLFLMWYEPVVVLLPSL